MGTANSGNRTERRGVKLRRAVTLNDPAAIFVRQAARTRYGVDHPTEEQTNAIVNEALEEYARRMEIPEPD